MKDKLDKFADEVRSLEGRLHLISTEDTYNTAVDLMLSLLDDLDMVSTSSILRRIEEDHLQEQRDALAEKDMEITALEKEESE